MIVQTKAFIRLVPPAELPTAIGELEADVNAFIAPMIAYNVLDIQYSSTQTTSASPKVLVTALVIYLMV